MTNKILFLIPDGVGIRNYLYSDILKNLKQESAIAFWSPLPESAFLETQQLHNITIDYKHIVLKPESVLSRIFRESATFGRLILNSENTNNPTILTNWNYNPKSLKLKILNKFSRIIGIWSSKKYNRILNLEKNAKKFWKRSLIEQYKKDLLNLQPSSIFITHQRVSNLMPICIAAKELGIPVITAIYSWDNLPKARLAVMADKYLVWSSYMKDEMKAYYPEINQDNVLITGTPQFEFYFKSELVFSREDFANTYNLDVHKKWICFSGDDTITSPNDPLYLKNCIESVQSNQDLNNVQIIFRRCPADFSKRYEDVLSEYSNIKVINPEWHTTEAGWNSFFPKFLDVSLLVNIVYHCDLVINVGSTMAHDFAQFDKPCLYINYDDKGNKKWKSEVVYNFQHFRTMEGLEAVGWLNAPNEISYKVLEALLNPNIVGKDRKIWLNKIVQHPVQESSKNITNVLLNIK